MTELRNIKGRIGLLAWYLSSGDSHLYVMAWDLAWIFRMDFCMDSSMDAAGLLLSDSHLEGWNLAHDFPVHYCMDFHLLIKSDQISNSAWVLAWT